MVEGTGAATTASCAGFTIVRSVTIARRLTRLRRIVPPVRLLEACVQGAWAQGASIYSLAVRGRRRSLREPGIANSTRPDQAARSALNLLLERSGVRGNTLKRLIQV